MLKEIYEQPKAIKDTLRGRLNISNGIIKLSGLDDYINKFLSAKKITIIACGTSWHSTLVAEYMFEKSPESRLKLNMHLSLGTRSCN